MSYQQIERAAQHVRGRLAPDVDTTAPLQVGQLFEVLDDYSVTVNGRAVRFDYAVKELPGNVAAEAKYDERKDRILIQMSREAYKELQGDVPHARHTVCHEIGHGVLHASQLMRMSTLPHQKLALERSRAHKFCEDTEWQADAFASALLMPAVGMHRLENHYGGINTTLLRQHFLVSYTSATYRLENYQQRRRQLIGNA